MHGRVYLDYHASAPADPRVIDVVARHMRETVGNPSSSDHAYGDEAAAVVDAAAENVAALVGARAEDVVFTAGATESLNLALQGFARWSARRLGRPPRVAVSAVEHRAVLETARALEREGRVALQVVPVDGTGTVDVDALRRLVRDGVDLVAVMAANHEVGTIQPVAEVASMLAEAGVTFLCDATQAVGKIPVDVTATPVTFLALSGHKLYGPKGVGGLIARGGAPLEAVSFGGGQQRGLRPGTLNVSGIAGLGEACRLRRIEREADEVRVAALRDRLRTRLTAEVDGLVVNGHETRRLAGNLHVSVPVPNQAVIARVRERLAISTGAACTSGLESPSHVLRAMGLPQQLQDGALRFGVGKFTTEQDVDRAVEWVAAAVREVRRALSAIPA